jgi:large subunit ribosomal protein L18
MGLTKAQRRARIKKRIRKVVNGTADRPRMAIFRSNKQIYAQLIDDINGVTLTSSSSVKNDKAQGVPKIDQAKLVGADIAAKAEAAGINNVVFDRGGYLYHGRVKALAEAAREGGLKF